MFYCLETSIKNYSNSLQLKVRVGPILFQWFYEFSFLILIDVMNDEWWWPIVSTKKKNDDDQSKFSLKYNAPLVKLENRKLKCIHDLLPCNLVAFT